MNQTETKIFTLTEISAETDTESFRSLLLMIQLNIFCTLLIETCVTKYQCYWDIIGNNFIEHLFYEYKNKSGRKEVVYLVSKITNTSIVDEQTFQI